MKTSGNFDSCNSCKRLGTSRLHELHESKFAFVSRIEFIRSKLSNFSAHVSGVSQTRLRPPRCTTSESIRFLFSVRCGRRGRWTRLESPVLTAPVSAVPALFATVRARPGPFRLVKPPPAALDAVLTGQNRPGRARAVANRAGTALTGAVRTGLKTHIPRRLGPAVAAAVVSSPVEVMHH